MNYELFVESATSFLEFWMGVKLFPRLYLEKAEF